jgi:transcriptional regulator with XRE-family HTH domain
MLKTTLQIKTLGTLLIEKRKEKNLEIKDVSQIIKIRATYLSALEEGRYDVLPSEVYLTGFLKNYAKFLGIDNEKIMAMYRRENERKATDSKNVFTKLKSNNLNFTLTPNKIVTILAGLAILLILIYLGSYVGKVLKKPALVLTSPVSVTEGGEATYRTDANFIELSGTVDIGSKFTINGQELKLNNFEKFTQEFKIDDGTNVFILKAENQFGRDTTITLTITKEASVLEISPTPTPTPKIISISIDILKKDTNVIVKIDGEKKTDRLYKIGSSLEFTAFKSFEITAANYASIQLKINGVAETVTTTTIWEVVDNEIVKK